MPARSSGRHDLPAKTAVSQQEQRPRPPLNPYLVLLVAILLPGFGHVLNGQARRGLIMQLFMIALGFITWQLAPPEASFIGRISGGLFVYALSIPEAYRVARIRWVAFQRQDAPQEPPRP
jgi:hypothetical protein